MRRNLIAATILFLPFIACLIFAIHRQLNHIKRTKAVILVDNLQSLRHAIDSYQKEEGRGPQSLQELVDGGYLREIPADPFTESNQTWILKKETQSPGHDNPPGIVDARSGATGADVNGKAYNLY